MTLPNFLVIGSGKGGTSSIYFYLKEHPQVFMSEIKEPNFFAYDPQEPGMLVWGSRSERWFPVRDIEAYEALFAGVTDEVAIGEASPVYFESRDAPGRIRATLPGVKLLLSLRNPIDRAYSGYWMGVRGGTDHRDVHDALHPADDLIRAGFYYRLVQRYLGYFDREHLWITLFDDLKSDPVATMQSIYRFLGVDDAFTPDVRVRYNPGGAPRSHLLQSLLISPRLRAVAKVLLRGPLRRPAVSLRNRNLEPPPPLPHEIEERLIELYRDDVGRLGELIGRDLSSWLERRSGGLDPP